MVDCADASAAQSGLKLKLAMHREYDELLNPLQLPPLW